MISNIPIFFLLVKKILNLDTKSEKHKRIEKVKRRNKKIKYNRYIP